jgi:hypothetical protein
MNLPAEVIISGPTAVAAFIWAAKRLSGLDLELRAYRELERAKFLRARAAAEAEGDGPSPRTPDELTYELLRRLKMERRMRLWMRRPRNPRSRPVKSDVPAWALIFLSPEDARRCSREWAAHLHERIADDELRAARRDRRRLARYAILLAVTRRAQRAVSKSRS